MSLTLYSAKSKVASKLKANGFEISAGEDIDGNQQINITQDDKPNDYPKFNCLYNKAEVDARVVNDYVEKGGNLEGFGNIPITKKISTMLKYLIPAKANAILNEELSNDIKSEKTETNKELIKEEFCVNTFNELISEESKTCEAIHDMHTDLMCAADGYEQLVLDENKGQCDVVKYIQTPTAPPDLSPDNIFYYKPFNNLADMLMNIIKNEKKNQNTKKILYDTFNETNLTKIINGTKQYKYDTQNHTVKTIGYKYGNNTEEVKADQLVEVKSPDEFLEIYIQNQKDNFINYPQIIQNLLLSSVLGYGLTSTLKLFTTALTENNKVKIKNIDGTTQKLDLNEYLNNVQLNINNIITSLNYWADYCSKIKSCDCNNNGSGGSVSQGNDILDYFNDQIEHLHDDIHELELEQLFRQVDNSVGSLPGTLIQPLLYREAIPEIQKQIMKQNQDKNKIKIIDRDHDRGAVHDESYIWDIQSHSWIRVPEGYYFPPGWRTRTNWEVPVNFIFDIIHIEWVQVDNPRRNNDHNPNWRNNFSDAYVLEYLARIYDDYNDGNEGLRWSDSAQEWYWFTSINHYTGRLTSDLPSRIRSNEDFGDGFVWNILDEQWQPHEMNFENMWRHNPEFQAPENFIWDEVNSEWVLLTQQHNKFPYGWRNNKDDDTVEINEPLYEPFGQFEWNEERGWLWIPANEPLLFSLVNEKETEEIKTDNSSAVALPDFVQGVDSFEEVLECYGVDICDDTPILDNNKPVLGKYIIKGDLEVNGKIICDSIPSSGTSSGGIITTDFSHEPGYPEYYVKSKDLVMDSMKLHDINYNVLVIKIPDEIKSAITRITDTTKMFRIILRNNILYDTDGNLIKEFFIYIKDGKQYNPVISRNPDTNFYSVMSIGNEDLDEESLMINSFYIALDKTSTVNPYELYHKGELSIQYLLSQDSLVAVEPTIRCDIIEAENALKLYKNDNLYLYLPDIITEENLEIELPDKNKGEKEFYKIIYKIPTDYVIPNGLEFSFKEFCFGNEWTLKWNGSEWTNNNCQGLLRGKLSSKLKKVNSKQNSDGAIGCFILIKDTKTHHSVIPESSNGLLYGLIENSTIDTTIWYTHKEESDDGALYDVEWLFDKKLNGASCEGYDMLNTYFTFGNLSSGKFNYLSIKKIALTITLRGSSISNTFTFESTGIRRTTKNDRAFIDLVPMIDCIEQLAYKWEDSKIKSRDIELYLRKDLVDPIEEISWNPETNPFQYIIRNQFYEIKPRPDAASTLYTDFNITSSKIITADNITTMRSDLNVVSNNYDVMNYDVSKIRKEVNTLNTQMAIQIMKTQYLEQAVNSIQVAGAIKLAFSTPMAVLGAIGLAVSTVGIEFGVHTIYNGNDVSDLTYEQLQNTYPDADTTNIQNVDAGQINQVVGSIGAEPDLLNSYWNQYRELVMDFDMWEGNDEMCDHIFNQLNELTQTIDREFPGAELPPWVSVIVHAPDVQTLAAEPVVKVSDKQILGSLIKWCEADYKRLDDPTKFKDNWFNPDKAVLSLSATIDICNRMRDSMKFPIMILAKNMEAINNVNMDEYYKKSEVDELLKAYDARISALEKKCANIE
ncbi:hypothetical protein M9Y10_037180 [Tritrichomonas musculus]|uniref:Uncharacterized protein n=1 Tax=Tritrichomonas musculus TaxID=1915356 RepID=A0ABR2GV82_9EUKA